MRRRFWIKVLAAPMAAWFALAGADMGRMPACPMSASGDMGQAMANGGAGIPGTMAMPGEAGRAPDTRPAGAPGADGPARGHDTGGSSHAPGCACPSACSSVVSPLASPPVVLTLAVASTTDRVAPPVPVLPARGVASHFLPYPSGPPRTA